MSIKLTDTQLMMLSAAAQRNDRYPVGAPNLKVAVAQKIASKLIGAGLVKEVRAKAGAPVWRRDEDAALSYTLRLTAAGANAVANDKSSEPGHIDDDDLRENLALARSSSGIIRLLILHRGRERDCARTLILSARRDEAGAGRRTASTGSRREHRRADRSDRLASARHRQSVSPHLEHLPGGIKSNSAAHIVYRAADNPICALCYPTAV